MRAEIQTQGSIRGGGLVGLTGALLLWVTLGTSVAQEEGVIAAGKADFETYCTVCHGSGGKGDGPMASQLRTQPADLTQITKRNEGNFPIWRIYRIIEGTEPLSRGHGGEEMPVWGDVFTVEASAVAGARVRGRIFQIIYYLQSIQEE